MHKHSIDISLFCHSEQGVQVLLRRMHASVRDQSDEMQRGASSLSVFHRLNEGVVAKELTGFDSMIDARGVHADYASRSDVQVPDLAVPHLPSFQTDVLAGCFDDCVGILLVPFIEMRGASKRNRIAFTLGGVTEPVENDQDKRRVD